MSGGRSLRSRCRNSRPSATHPGGKYVLRNLRIFTSVAKRSSKALVTAVWVKGQFRASSTDPNTTANARTAVLTTIQRRLSNLNLEPVFMAPPEVFPPLGISHLRKHNIPTVPLHQVLAVFTIFSVVPRMVVAAVPIVIAPLVMISVVSSGCDRSDDGGAQE